MICNLPSNQSSRCKILNQRAVFLLEDVLVFLNSTQNNKGNPESVCSWSEMKFCAIEVVWETPWSGETL